MPHFKNTAFDMFSIFADAYANSVNVVCEQ